MFVPVVIALAAADLASGWAPARARHGAFTAAVGGADHRLPVRARAGDADGAAGRHRRGAKLGILIRGPEVLEATRRSTRSCSTRPAPSRPGGWPWSTCRRRRRGRDGRCDWRRARAGLRAPDRPRDRRGRAGAVGIRCAVEGFAQPRRARRPRAGRGPRRRRRPAPPAARRRLRGRRRQAAVRASVWWTGRRAAVLVVADTVKPTLGRGRRRLRALGLGRCC